jgi:C4-dicarboxylate transporter, DctM subunit
MEHMPWLVLGLLVLLASGIPIYAALGVLGAVAIYVALPAPVPSIVASQAWNQTNSFILTAIPLFVFMGELLLRSGVTEEGYRALHRWLGRVPGGLAHANIAACSVFAAACGSSSATTASVGGVSLPEMLKRGYDRPLSFGSIAAGGTLGILIPPSICMILFGALTGISIGKLYVAGVVPGMMLSALFMVYIALAAWRRPHLVPRSTEPFSLGVAIRSSLGILPVVALIVAVLGSLYLGVATPTEAAALGASGALVVAACRRRLAVRMVAQSAIATVHVTSMLLLIVVASTTIHFVLIRLGVPSALVDMVEEQRLSANLVLVLVIAVVTLAGMLIDPISMMVMVLPTLAPVLTAVNVDLIWFGVVMVVLVEAALLTPPMALNIFVVRGLDPSASTWEVARGTLPFVVMMYLLIGMLFIFPALALWLPAKMF